MYDIGLSSMSEVADHAPSGHFVMMVSGIAILFAIVFFVVGITAAYKGKATQTVTFAVS